MVEKDNIVNVFLLLIIILFREVSITASFYRGTSLKYILTWSPMANSCGFNQMYFMSLKCKVPYCFFHEAATLPSFENHVKDFDAVIFLINYAYRSGMPFPEVRNPEQIYVFMSMEGPYGYPVCDEKYDDLINITMTYQLRSDIPTPYFIVKNKKGKVVAPSENVKWIKVKDMKPIGKDIKDKLKLKRKAAAWLVSHCDTDSKRELIVQRLQMELMKYNLSVDIYGHCSKVWCGNHSACWSLIQEQYYFYLSFENAISEDYVTEKLVNPLNHFTVPIVYGGANYSRFIPDGMYIHAVPMKESELAKSMNDIIKDKERYYSFFKWHNHYTYHHYQSESETMPLCKLCAYLNNKNNLNTRKELKNFLNWWNLPGKCGRKSKTETEVNLLEFHGD